MSKSKSKEEIQLHSQNAIKKISDLLNSYIASNDYATILKADKLSYWLEDYAKFLDYEPNFKPDKLKKYKRGEIVKVHLGYNIGSEEGGLHYCVVLDKSNSIKNPVVTVVPLTSLKSSVDINNLPLGTVYLGNSLYTAMFAKLSSLETSYDKRVTTLDDELTLLEKNLDAHKSINANLNNSILQKAYEYKKEIEFLKQQEKFIKKVKNEAIKMNKGSLALVSQVTTVSKIRIYDPKTNFDILSKIKLSNENLNLIDDEFKKMYIK